MNRGEIWRTRDPVPERGNKPGFYVLVSRQLIIDNDDVSTVVCAPVYSRILGLDTEVVIGPEDGVPHESAVRCDFLMLMFKSKLTGFVGFLRGERVAHLDKALAIALDLPAASARDRLGKV